MRLAITKYIDVPAPTVERIENFLLKHKKFKIYYPSYKVKEYVDPWKSTSFRMFFNEGVSEEILAEELFNFVSKELHIPPVSLYRYVMGDDIDMVTRERIIKCGQ